MSVGLRGAFTSAHSSPCVRPSPRTTQRSAKPPCPTAELGAEGGTPLRPGLAWGLREAGTPQPGDKGDREGKSCRTQESPWADPVISC